MAQAQKKRIITLKTSLLVVFGLVIFFGGGLVVLGYVLPGENRLGEQIRRTLPLPLVVIGYRDMITTRALMENMSSVRKFYETQDFSQYGIRVDFSTEEGKKRLLIREKEVLNKMLEDRMLAHLAQEKGVRVTREAAADGVRRKLEEYGGNEADIAENLKRLYGWSLRDFEEKVVIPNLYEERLTDMFQKEGDTRAEAERRIKEAREAIRSGVAFDDVAKQFSEGRTREEGGELGWFASEDLAKELQRPVATQKEGAIGDIIESELGFHIVLVQEIRRENGKTFYRIKQIFTKKKTLADWLTDKMRASPPMILSRDFMWDVEAARIELRDENLKRFEQELLEKTDNQSLLLL